MIRAIAMFALFCSSSSVWAETALLTAPAAGCTRASLQGTFERLTHVPAGKREASIRSHYYGVSQRLPQNCSTAGETLIALPEPGAEVGVWTILSFENQISINPSINVPSSPS